MQPEIDRGEPPDNNRLRATIRTLASKKLIFPSDVHELLVLKESVLAINPTFTQTDMAFLAVVLDRWDEGERTTAFEYLLREACDAEVTDQKTYEEMAPFWVKCAEALLVEPLCASDASYELRYQKITERWDGDPELWDAIYTALKFNQQFVASPEGEGTFLRYQEYFTSRAELFGPTVKFKK